MSVRLDFQVGDIVCPIDKGQYLLSNLRVVNIENKEIINMFTRKRQVRTMVTVYSPDDKPYVFPAEQLQHDYIHIVRFGQKNKVIDIIPF